MKTIDLKHFLFLLFLLSGNLIFAQDNIIKKNGEEVKAKVEEVTLDMIKYREFDNLSGPLYNT